MPYHVEFDPPAPWAAVVADDAPSSVALLRQAIRRLVADPRFGPRAGVLLDLRRAATAPTVGDATELALAFAGADLLGGRPVALLVEGTTPLGVAHLVAVMTELKGGRARAFTDADEARRWLASHTASAPDAAP